MATPPILRRHLIVEGMDGSGKDTLISKLLMQLPGYTLHERASTSLGGPVANLSGWVIDDLTQMPTQPLSIYNRHPLISEPIYAPYRRIGGGLRGAWRDRSWVALNRVIAAEHCLVILCHPSWFTVQYNLLQTSQGHMPGVMENARSLWDAYDKLVWPGRCIRYNYRRDSVPTLMQTINMKLGRQAPK
jgi:hypothetical protein